MTIVLFPNCPVGALKHVTIQIAEAMQTTIQELYGISLQIKYPNDLLLQGKKIGGILTQASSLQNTVNELFIGIGFNVNQEEFSDAIGQEATSLKKEFGQSYEREEIVQRFIENLENSLKESNILTKARR